MLRKRPFLTSAIATLRSNTPPGRVATAASFVCLISAACGSPSARPIETAKPNDQAGLGAYVLEHGTGSGASANNTTEQANLGLRLEAIDPKRPVKFDGMLSEWPSRTKANHARKGESTASAMSVALQYDDTRLYIGADIVDDRFVRTTRFSLDEDRVRLVVAFPNGRGAYKTYAVDLFAGKPGESSGAVRVSIDGGASANVADAKIVEMPTATGYSLEASIPWSTFAEARSLRVGLRGFVEYNDADAAGHLRALHSTSHHDGASAATFPRLPSEAELSLDEQLIHPKSLSAEPSIDLYGDVTGDGISERIAAFGNFLVVYGSHYLGGDRFFFREVAGEIRKVELQRVTGRNASDVILWTRATDSGISRERIDVLSATNEKAEPRSIFTHEIAVSEGAKRIENNVTLGASEIRVTSGQATGYTAATFPGASDQSGVLTPWGSVAARTFKFDGTSFTLTDEKQNDSPKAAKPSRPKPEPKDEDRRTHVSPTPEGKTAAVPIDRASEAFRSDFKIDRGQNWRFAYSANVAEDGRAETIAVLERYLVVTGPGFRGGTSYAYIQLTQFDQASSIRDISVRDLTGDGFADIVVTGSKETKNAGDSDPTTRDLMFVYQVRPEGIARIFALEIARERTGKSVRAVVQFTPARSGKGSEIDVSVGKANGWTEHDYPWAPEVSGGAIEPILLPWSRTKRAHYTWDGSKFILST